MLKSRILKVLIDIMSVQSTPFYVIISYIVANKGKEHIVMIPRYHSHFCRTVLIAAAHALVPLSIRRCLQASAQMFRVRVSILIFL